MELYGPENGGWYSTSIPDWVALCPDLRDADVRGYAVLRGLVVEKYANPVRRLSLDELAELIPGVNGRPSSRTRIRDILRSLTAVGLVTTPEGEPLTTSSRKSAAGRPLRIRINDAAPEGYAGWRNGAAKLKALQDAAAASAAADGGPGEDAADADPGPEDAPAEAGRNSDPGPSEPGSGRNSDPAGRDSDPLGRNSDPLGRNSDPDSRADLQERDLTLVLSRNSSLSDQPSHTGSVPGEGEERENGSPDDTPRADAPAAEVPPQRAAADTGAGDAGLARVVDAYAAAAKAAGRLASRRVLAEIRGQAAELVQDGAPVEWLAARAAEMPAHNWTDLERHASRSPVPMIPPAAAGAVKRSVVAACPDCDEYGWLADPDDVDGPPVRCTHPTINAA